MRTAGEEQIWFGRAGSGGSGSKDRGMRRRLDRRGVGPAGKAALGASPLSCNRHHEVSTRKGTGPWQGNWSASRIIVPIPHCGHRRRFFPLSAA